MEISKERKGLTGFQLKYFAAFLMVLDHLYVYLSDIMFIPVQFKWLGRVVAPIFVYMTVEGYRYTRNKKKYLLRLYIAHILMSLMNNLVMKILPSTSGIIISNSMFGTMFIVVLYLLIVDFLIDAVKNKSIKKTIIGIVLFLLPIIINILFLIFMATLPLWTLGLVMTFVPMPLLVEEGLFFALLGIVFYLNRNNKKNQIISYILISLFFFLNAIKSRGILIDYQWMMIFASIFIYLYNGERGNGSRNFFYIFYPGHIYIIWLIGYILR